MVAEKAAVEPGWEAPIHAGDVGDSIVIYPEIVSGNPLKAAHVVRWALNDPGLLGGDTHYSDDELVFAFNPRRLDVVSFATNAPLGSHRILRVGLVDPSHIYFDSSVEKTVDCYFTHKGHELEKRFPLPNDKHLLALENNTPNIAALGDLLRRTRRLYSYDHYSNVLREAAICGCEVLVVDREGRWHDPETCDCARNINWGENFREHYAAEFRDRTFVRAFIAELRTRWHVPKPSKTLSYCKDIGERLGDLRSDLKRRRNLLRRIIRPRTNSPP